MLILACIVLAILGVFVLIRTSGGDGKEEFTARLGRSLGGASHAIPGLTTARGQAPAHLMPGPAPDEIGPEEHHVYVMPSDTSQGPTESSPTDAERSSATEPRAAIASEPSRPTTSKSASDRLEKGDHATNDAD